MAEAIENPGANIALGGARSDIVAGAVIVSAALLFIGTGSQVLSDIVNALAGMGGGPDKSLSIAVVLNIALILFGWRRYRDLSCEARARATAEARAEHFANCDPLTGLLNRRAFIDQGAEAIAVTRTRGKATAMLVIDIDHFNTINELHTHAVGDVLLSTVAKTLKADLPASTLLARLGGDEFAVLLPHDPDAPAQAEAVAQSIVKRLGSPFDVDQIVVHVSASVGIASTDAHNDAIDGLMRRADIAMYAAKNQGRNRFAWFDLVMEQRLQARNLVEVGLRAGIPRGEIVPYFEQQIDLSTGRLHGFEMLARWDHPTRGLVGPDQFIAIAEESGLIADLSFSVMRQAFEEARSWDAALGLSVNISPQQLKDPWLAQKMVKLLTETNFPAQRLEVEITESSLFENLALAQSIIGSLKNQGIRLALDDFGTGFSSLAHLRALPFDRIKIDRSFVSSIIENSESLAIVSAITRLGESLGLPVTAEGIEDAAIEERLRQLGCHQGQGWHYGRPLPVQQVRSLLAERGLLPTVREPAPQPQNPSGHRTGLRVARRG